MSTDLYVKSAHVITYLCNKPLDILKRINTEGLDRMWAHYINLIQKDRMVSDDVEINDRVAYNIEYLAYLRFIPFDQCIAFYLERGLMESHIMPHLPIAVKEIRLPASFMLHHNVKSDYVDTQQDYYDFMEQHGFPYTRENTHYVAPILPTVESKMAYWLRYINNHYSEDVMQYMLVWIRHSTDPDAETMRELMPQMPNEIQQLYRKVPKRVKFYKVTHP